MKNKMKPSMEFFVASLLFALTVLGYGCYLFYKNRNYIISREIVNMNDYVTDSSGYRDELPMNEVVSLKIKKCYGQFYKYNDNGIAHQCFIIGLDDGSVIGIETIDDVQKQILSRMMETDDSFEIELNGSFQKIRKGKIKDNYLQCIEELKTSNKLPDDLKIRFVNFKESGEREYIVFKVILCFVFGLIILLSGLQAKPRRKGCFDGDRCRKIGIVTKSRVIILICVTIIFYVLNSLDDGGRNIDVESILFRLLFSVFCVIEAVCIVSLCIKDFKKGEAPEARHNKIS